MWTRRQSRFRRMTLRAWRSCGYGCATITASVGTGAATLPVGMGICATGANGSCLAAPQSTVTQSIPAGATPTFAIFATATAAIPLEPATNRIFVQFTDSTGAVRGTTSVALTSPAPMTSSPPPYRY